MKLYGARRSPFVRKVRIVLEEKGIPYELEEIVPVPKTPELLALSPLGKIPILEDGGAVVPDSSVICAYLEKKHPSPALIPEDPAELARALFLEEYADSHMSESMGAIALERFVKPNLLGQPTDEARLAELLEAVTARWFGTPAAARGSALPPVMDYLESQVPADGDCVLSRFSIADAALGPQLAGALAPGIEIDAKRWPRTLRYYRALRARPSFETALAL